MKYFEDHLNCRDNREAKLSYAEKGEILNERRREIKNVCQEEVLKSLTKMKSEKSA